MLWLLGFLGGLGCLGNVSVPKCVALAGIPHWLGWGWCTKLEAWDGGSCPHGQPQSLSPHQDPGELPLCDKDTGLRALVDCKEGLEGTKDSVLVMQLGAAPFCGGGEVKSPILPL